MASAFMSRMEVMANNQQRMLELFMGQSSGNGSGGNPRALAAIMNTGQASRRMPTMLFEDVQLPTTPRTNGGGVLALQLGSLDPETPPWSNQSPPEAMPVQSNGIAGASDAAAIVLSGGAAMPPLQPPGLAGASGDAAIVPSGSAVASKTALADLNDMLSILGERKVEKDAVAAAAKAEAMSRKGEGKGKAKAKAEAGAKGEGKGKAKAKAKAGAKDKGKCKAEAKAGLPPKAKAGAKAGAKAKAKAGAKAGAVVLKFGCGKCRGGVTGCARCRTPGFAGLRWSVDDM